HVSREFSWRSSRSSHCCNNACVSLDADYQRRTSPWISTIANVMVNILRRLGALIFICACKSQTSISTLCPDIDNSIPGQLSEEEALGNSSTNLSEYIQAHYEKREVRIPMRDGISLFTAIYTPKNRSKTYPIMIYRTPYSVKP